MYGARSGKVVRRVSSLASPMLASKAVVKGAAGKAVVVVLGCSHAVKVDDGGRSIVGVSRGHDEIWAIAVNWVLAGGHIDGIREIYRDALPFCVGHHKGEGTRDVMHGAHASSVGFHVFEPFLEVVTRVINKRWGDAWRWGRHG